MLEDVYAVFTQDAPRPIFQGGQKARQFRTCLKVETNRSTVKKGGYVAGLLESSTLYAATYTPLFITYRDKPGALHPDG